MATASLLDCPPELIVKILSHLNVRDILAAGQLCRFIHCIVNDSLILRYLMELEIAGLKETSTSDHDRRNLSTLDRLNRLRTREERWRTMDWWRSDQVNLLPSCPLYELYGGVFLQMWEYQAGFMEKRTVINVFTLPSALKGIPAVIKNHSCELGVGILLELAIDPAQDLFVTIGTSAYDDQQNELILVAFLRTLDDKPHPAAATSHLKFRAGAGSGEFWAQMRIVPQIAGDLLGILICAVEGATNGIMQVWRWTTGELLLRLEPPAAAPSFTFLSEDTLVLPCISQHPEFETNLHVYRFSLDSTVRSAESYGSPLVTYRLPAMNTGNIIGSSLICRSYPLPSNGAYVPRPPGSNSKSDDSQTNSNSDTEGDSKPPVSSKATWLRSAPFGVDASNRLVTFSFIFNVHHSDELGLGTIAWQESYVLFTHVATLLQHVPPTPNNAHQPGGSATVSPLTNSSEESAKIIPWDEWSQRSRWLADRPRRNWYSHTFGHRFVRPTSPPTEAHRDCFYVQVLDFNPLAIRHLQRETSRANGKGPSSSETGLKESLQQGVSLIDHPADEAVLSLSSMSLTSQSPETDAASASRSKPIHGRRLVTEPSTVRARVFNEPVTTALPYFEITSSKPMYEFTGLMMDEEHILVLKRIGFDLHLDIFSV